MATWDAIVVGGGPAGSTCARGLVRRGLRVALVDRARFPRVKLCAGWVSAPIWDALELAPADYPHGLWEWHRCHVHYRDARHTIPCHGWFIRRCQLDDFLLRRSGAELFLGAAVKQVERGDDGLWRVDLPGGELRAPYLVGAGGTHCPVARVVAPARPRRPLGVQELELQADAGAVARTRLGADGEPELLLFDGLGGYGWNVPKTDWLNVGCGTLDAHDVLEAWQVTRDHLRDAAHLPPGIEPALDHMKGHSYYLFEPDHLVGAQRDRALLAGDALGLAHPITGEGILPAVLSGRIAAEAIAAGDAAGYPGRLARDPVLADYRRAHRVLELVRGRRRQRDDGRSHPPRRGSALAGRAVARGFAWMFSGARLPAPRLLDLVLGDGRRP
ncbi:MAG TPA: NAD(P)-binding protein [Kofleriaceae bacterium]|nr:NAD(P)-binding protein [Kofleriaceae bacterium]